MIAIIIPALNEASNLKVLIPLIHNELLSDYKVIVVDDNSTDGTLELLNSMSYPIEVVSRPCKQGYASAIIDGLSKGLNNDILIHMDADLSHNPRYLKQMIKELDNCDIVIGSRYNKGGVKGIKFYRLVISRLGNYVAEKMLGLKVKDCTSGFRVYKREVFDVIDLNKTRMIDGYGFLIMTTDMLVKHKLKIKEFPIVFEDRYDGKSKISKFIILEALFLVLMLATQRKMKH